MLPTTVGLSVADCYAAFQSDCEERFLTLKSNEEELNHIFIDIYGLQDELTPDEFAALHTRVLPISRETRVANAIGDRGGAIDAMPRYCVTIGMAEILSAKKVRLGVFRDWHRAVVRQAAYGEVSAHFPATLLQRHPDAMIYVNANAAQQPF